MNTRAAGIAYGLIAYLAFAASFAVFAMAAEGWLPSVDGPPAGRASAGLAIDLALLLGFGLQHSIMARRSFKARLAQVLPAHLERSTYVLASSVALGALVFCWRPIAGEVWMTTGALAGALRGLSIGGFAIALAASFAIDHGALFGLRQARGGDLPPPSFRLPLPYRAVRHPMMLGILLGVWAAPHLTMSHAVFAAGLTVYILVGIAFEERDLLRDLGGRYAAYCDEVPMLLPRLRRVISPGRQSSSQHGRPQ
jgi:methanethiol S-methyltransferase